MNWQTYWLDFFGGLNRTRRRSQPMYSQIVEKLKNGIISGQLSDNDRLPTNRELADLLQVDRSTVSRAYLELEQSGLIDSHVGRGTFVRLTRQHGPESLSGNSGTMIWAEKFSRASQTAHNIVGRQPAQTRLPDYAISFAGGIPSGEFYPDFDFRTIVTDLIQSQRSGDMFGYSPAEGHPELRQQVLKYLSRQGLAADDEELLIVSGSQQAIDIVTDTLVDPGDVVFVEEPTYFWALCKLSSSQARCLPVPADQHGLQVDILDELLSRHRAKLLYVMPTFQNPTGSTMSMDRRRQLLELAKRHNLPILEDNFVGDLRYSGQPLPSLRALDESGQVVIQQGTFSKALCPGLRLGWLVAPREAMARLSLSKRTSDLSTNSLSQMIMAEYLKGGFYEKHLEQIKLVYKARLDTMCDALRRVLGGSVTWFKPDGGLFVWVRLGARMSAQELLPFAEREGVTFSPGDMFFVNGDKQEFIRLSFIQTDEKQIQEGVRRLGRALEAYITSRQGSRAGFMASGSRSQATWV